MKALLQRKVPKYYKELVESMDKLAIRQHIKRVQKIHGTDAAPEKYLVSTVKANSELMKGMKEVRRKKHKLLEKQTEMAKKHHESMTFELWFDFCRSAGVPIEKAVKYSHLFGFRFMDSIFWLHSFEDDKYWSWEFREEDQYRVLMHADRIMNLAELDNFQPY
ncbi:hypothetical protein DMENIID0001_060590 [Sergentomyia squamirostris]